MSFTDVQPLLKVEELSHYYGQQLGCRGINFELYPGEVLAIVGESGCGKSTLARILTMIDAPTSGELTIDGQRIDINENPITQEQRRSAQIVFQNPYGSLNPRQKIGDVLTEPLMLNTDKTPQERKELALAMLKKVGMEEAHYERLPHMFSGGQRQRIAIARALMLNPSLLILDEPVSALDLSMQAQILNLLSDLQEEFDLTYVFVSHDLSVVKHIADEVMVMYFGEVVEHESRDQIFKAPKHEYTRTLFNATPQVDVESIRQRVAQKRPTAS